MIRVNPNYSKIQANYLFAEVAQRVKAYQAENPAADLIRLGIGDVTRALPAACVAAMEKAAREMGADETFRGYGPDYGYAFLREAIAEGDFRARGCDVSPDEIFVSDGAKCDTGNFQEILDAAARVAVPDPVYPVYVDSNVMAGRTGPAADGRYAGLVYLEGSEANGYVPALPAEPVDVVYLCFPNNPTGAVASREQLASWVAWAKENGALILFDAAYEAFIRDPDVPHSIYEIPGAKEVAVEFRSFSKTAGFTGTRCGYTVVPKALKCGGVSLNALWNRRQTTKFNGVPYIVQRGAEAVYSEEGQKQIRETIAYYLHNAAVIREGLAEAGFTAYGGVNAPYIWLKTPGGMTSWEFFDELINRAGVVGTPGSGFGPSGEGYFRLTSFGSLENSVAAIERIKKAFA